MVHSSSPKVYHVSVFENGCGVKVLQLQVQPPFSSIVGSEDGTEVYFTKRSEVVEFLGTLKQVCDDEDSEDDFESHAPTEAQTDYWSLVNDSVGEEPLFIGENLWR